MVDRLEVDDHDGRVGRLANGANVVGRHHDRIAFEEARAAAVDDDRARPVALERVAHLVAPDRVAGDVDAVEDEAGHRAERLPERAGPVPASGDRDVETEPFVRVVGGRLGSRGSRSASRLAGCVRIGIARVEQRRGAVVEVVLVQVRDDHAVDALDDALRGNRERDERVSHLVRGVLDRRPRTGVVEHRVDEDPLPRRLEQQRRVADQGQLHTRPSRTQPLWPPRPIAFESATSTCASRASFGHVVEVALGVGLAVVDRRRQHAVAERERRT